MKAIVFFEDGHTEKVLYHTYTKGELIWTLKNFLMCLVVIFITT